MTTVHFTIPVAYDAPNSGHPFNATMNDWFDVEVDDSYEYPETEARLYVNDLYGNHVWCSTYLDGEGWDSSRNKHYHGECKQLLKVHN